MLPETVVNQLQAGRELIADEYLNVTVLFAEVCQFDTISGQLAPDQVVELLNTIFSKFDLLVDAHSVHKIETIGAVCILYQTIDLMIKMCFINLGLYGCMWVPSTDC